MVLFLSKILSKILSKRKELGINHKTIKEQILFYGFMVLCRAIKNALKSLYGK